MLNLKPAYIKKIKEDAKPDYVAGHSLGEYNALQAAGVISFEDGLKLVKKRGELMSKAKNGGMAAIINTPEEKINSILKEAKLTTIDIANLNSPKQIVISGLKEDISKSQPFFEKANAMFIPINTSGAFHSQHMKSAENEFKKVIKRIKFSKPKIPVIANVTAKPYEASKIAENLVKQISNCVRWTDSILYLLNEGKGKMEFEELGVGNVLTKLVKAIEKSVAPKEEKNNNASEDQSPEVLVNQWNKSHAIGTKVISELYDTELETRTEAMLLFGHRAAIYMKGYNGYFDLRELKPVG